MRRGFLSSYYGLTFNDSVLTVRRKSKILFVLFCESPEYFVSLKTKLITFKLQGVFGIWGTRATLTSEWWPEQLILKQKIWTLTTSGNWSSSQSTTSQSTKSTAFARQTAGTRPNCSEPRSIYIVGGLIICVNNLIKFTKLSFGVVAF